MTSEYHFLRGPDGVYTDSVYPYDWWAGVRAVFEEVSVIARVRDAPLPEGARRVDGPGLEVVPVPDFVGSRGLARQAVALGRIAWDTARRSDAFLLRTPGVIGTALREALRVSRSPYGIAVVGDPGESLLAGDRAMQAMRRASRWILREQVRGAAASRYSTERHLQRLFPPRTGTFSVGVSDLTLPDDVLDGPGATIRDDDRLSIVFLGSLERSYKGLDVLLDALAQTTLPHTLEIGGGGRLRATYEGHAAHRGLRGRATFHGFVTPGHGVYDFLRPHDLLVLPSRTEGMPRVLVEGMAVGLPALATPVGGVVELLEPAEQVPVGNAAALARAIDVLARDAGRRRRLGAANRLRAREFRASVADAKLDAFYRAIRDASRR